MGLFEFLLPEVAEAQHLRRISSTLSYATKAVGRQELDTNRIEYHIDKLQQKVIELEQENQFLGLLFFSLLKRLSEQHLTTIKEVFESIDEADLVDGVKDGKVDLARLRAILGLELAPETENREEEKDYWFCESCHHKNTTRISSCMYCGVERVRE